MGFSTMPNTKRNSYLFGVAIAGPEAHIGSLAATPVPAVVDFAVAAVLVDRLEALPLPPGEVLPRNDHIARVDVGLEAVHPAGNGVHLVQLQDNSAHRVLDGGEQTSIFERHLGLVGQFVLLPDADFVHPRLVQSPLPFHHRQDDEVRVAVLRLQVAGHAGTGVRVLEERQHHCHCQSQYDHVGSHTCKSRQ
jgi:hypothetical protein